MATKQTDEANKLHWSKIMWKSFNAADLSLSRKLAFCSNPGTFRPIMILLELSGHGVPWLAGTAVIIFRAPTLSEKEVFLNLLLALLIDLVVVGVLKASFRRPRPIYNKKDMFLTVSVDHFSFPSGHATRVAMVTVFILSNLLISLVLKVVLLSWALCVGTSRVVLGRHHISDVILGFLIGYLQYYWIVEKAWISWSTANHVLSLIM